MQPRLIERWERLFQLYLSFRYIQKGIIIYGIISMKEALLLSFKNAETITVKDLQYKLQAKKSSAQTHRNQQKRSQETSNLTIISPFYERLNHKPDCKCKYHKKPQRVIVKKRKMKTEPNQAQLPNLVNRMEKKAESKLEITQMENLFDKWKNKLQSEEIKKIYSDYLKNVGNLEKVKRLNKVDCHNEAFEEFLRNNYLIILERKTRKEEIAKQKQNLMKEKQSQRQKQGVKSKSSQRLLHKVFTEGNIDFEPHSEFIFRKQLSVRDGSFRKSQFDTSSKDDVVSKETIKMKKLGIRGTGKTLELIDQQQIRSRKEDPRRKRAKFTNSRPSFFGLIEDQQLLRELCLKLMNQNKRANREAQHIVKHLIQSDIEAYQKMIEDIQADLQSGIKLRNLNDEQANLLIKIVLNKIHRQAKASDSRDQYYSHKNSLIEELCNKYGWPKQDKIIELADFWKMRHERGHNSNIYSGKSFGHSRESKSTLSRNNLSDLKQGKKSRSKVTIKDEKRASGFYNQKSDSRLSKLNQSSTKTFIHDKSIDEVIESNRQIDFKINEKRTGIKAGVFGKSRKEKRRTSNFYTQNDNKMYGGKKNYGIYNRSKFIGGKYVLQTLQQSEDGIIEQDQVSQMPGHRSKKGESSNEQRASSFFLHADNQVQRHIEVNKRFLKRIEHDLIDNQCEKLIIGMGESIITKKRKIRAMHQALETDELKNSEYYHDILRYLEIYEDYCDLVLKSKKERVVIEKSNASIAYFTSQSEQKQGEEASLNLLLDDLKKQRELKFINLNLLKQKQNPKEELILKIPQYTTKMVCKSKKKQTTIQNFGQSESESEQSIPQIKQTTIMQKQLLDKVSLFIHKDQLQKRQKTEFFSEREQIDDAFMRKIEHYRKVFKLSPSKF